MTKPDLNIRPLFYNVASDNLRPFHDLNGSQRPHASEAPNKALSFHVPYFQWSAAVAQKSNSPRQKHRFAAPRPAHPVRRGQTHTTDAGKKRAKPPADQPKGSTLSISCTARLDRVSTYRQRVRCWQVARGRAMRPPPRLPCQGYHHMQTLIPPLRTFDGQAGLHRAAEHRAETGSAICV